LTIGLFILLAAVHVLGIREAAEVQVVATSCAISGLLLFLLGSAEAVAPANIVSEPLLPFGWQGLFAAIPFAAWFFLGLGGVAVAAEETKNADRNLPLGLLAGAFSVVLAGAAVWYSAAGSVSWRLLAAQNYPLLYVLNAVQSEDKVLQVTFLALGLIGFVASLLGLVHGYSRQVFALARAGYFPHFLSRLHPGRQTPYLAVVVPGLLALLGASFWSLEVLVALAVFSGLVVYLLVILAFLKIRKSEPDLIHTSKTPGYPYLFWLAAILLTAALGVFVFFKLFEAWAVFVAWLAAIAHFFIWVRLQIRDEAPEESGADSLKKRINVELH
jgi:ethanolamine permease